MKFKNVMWYPGWNPGTQKGHLLKTKEIRILTPVKNNVAISVQGLLSNVPC